jgi:hypothetical protein
MLACRLCSVDSCLESSCSILSTIVIFPFLLLLDILFSPRSMCFAVHSQIFIIFRSPVKFSLVVQPFILIVSSAHHGTDFCFAIFF